MLRARSRQAPFELGIVPSLNAQRKYRYVYYRCPSHWHRSFGPTKMGLLKKAASGVLALPPSVCCLVLCEGTFAVAGQSFDILRLGCAKVPCSRSTSTLRASLEHLLSEPQEENLFNNRKTIEATALWTIVLKAALEHVQEGEAWPLSRHPCLEIRRPLTATSEVFKCWTNFFEQTRGF